MMREAVSPVVAGPTFDRVRTVARRIAGHGIAGLVAAIAVGGIAGRVAIVGWWLVAIAGVTAAITGGEVVGRPDPQERLHRVGIGLVAVTFIAGLVRLVDEGLAIV